MSQKETQNENSQKSVTLSQNPRSSQVEIVGLYPSGQVTVSMSAPVDISVPLDSQVTVSQDRVTFQFNDSQGSCAASQVLSQAQKTLEENVSSQASVLTQEASSQAAVPTVSQFSQTSPSLSQEIAQSQKLDRSQKTILQLEAVTESATRTSSQNRS